MIIGAAGMIGRKLAEKIAQSSEICGQLVMHLTLVDVIGPKTLKGFSGQLSLRKVDVSQDDGAQNLISRHPDVIFHLASIVSGEAEQDFDKGYRVNLGGMQNLLEGIRGQATANPYRPRFVFTSSIAVYGTPMPDVIGDDFHLTPQTSYGTQKAICELLLNDYSRKGFIDGVGTRLPTICIRPGAPTVSGRSIGENCGATPDPGCGCDPARGQIAKRNRGLSEPHRQSGTSGSPSILNASPEAAAGGGLALLQTGDRVRVDLVSGRVDALVAADEWDRRRGELAARGGYQILPDQTPWQRIFRKSVGQFDEGMVLEGCSEIQSGAAHHIPGNNH